jgi:hypothetical protein
VRFTDWSRAFKNDDGRLYCGYPGTVKQAVLLGLAATISHTSVVWLIAMGGMYVSQKFTAESAEPWFQLISAIIILATAAWMFWRTWRGEKLWKMEQEEEHGGHHDHDETRIIDTGHGSVELSIFEEGQPPHWRLRSLSGKKWEARDISLVTNRGTGTFSQIFDFVEKDGFMESALAIPEPHSFDVRLSLVIAAMYMIMTLSSASMNTATIMTTITPHWRGWMLIPASTRMPTKKHMRTTSKNALLIAA